MLKLLKRLLGRWRLWKNRCPACNLTAFQKSRKPQRTVCQCPVCADGSLLTAPLSPATRQRLWNVYIAQIEFDRHIPGLALVASSNQALLLLLKTLYTQAGLLDAYNCKFPRGMDLFKLQLYHGHMLPTAGSRVLIFWDYSGEQHGADDEPESYDRVDKGLIFFLPGFDSFDVIIKSMVMAYGPSPYWDTLAGLMCNKHVSKVRIVS